MVKGKSCEYLALQMLIVCSFNYGSKLVDHKDFIFPLHSLGCILLKIEHKTIVCNENRPSENACNVFVDEVEIEDGLLFKEIQVFKYKKKKSRKLLKENENQFVKTTCPKKFLETTQ
jgi:hypothetical protein